MTNKNNKKGFTIIEVVLVLAIAGLIFLMVFIALPALQRSQRNTRRRQDMSRILAAFNAYQANNNGNFPSSTEELNSTGTFASKGFSYKYVKGGDPNSDAFTDPDGSDYTFNSIYDWGASETPSYTPATDVDHNIGFHTTAKCSGNETTPVQKDTSGGKRSIAITYVLEGGAVYCGDNQ